MPPADSAPAAECRAALLALVEGRLSPKAAAWLRAECGAPKESLEALQDLLLEVPRALGKRGLIASFAARASALCPGACGPQAVGSWRVDEAARVLILSEFADAAEEPFRALFEVYDKGDTETRVAALRSLSFVGPAADEAQITQGLELVRDAGRTYLSELLSAAWRHNPFTAEHLPLVEFRKAVLKAFFSEVPVAGFLRLEERADADLAQSLCEYIDERLAAGRAVPREIWPIAALHPRPGLVARLIGNLEHPDPEERAIAARALGNARDPRAESFLRERLEREDAAEVRAALEAALGASLREA